MKLDYLKTQKNYIQLGTIMTDKNYRNQGLSKYLMNIVLKEFSEKNDEVYLFANDSVLYFYPKFGFQKKRNINTVVLLILSQLRKLKN